MSSIPAAVKEAVERIRSSDEAVLVKVEKITETLVSAGLAYRQTITRKESLVHPANSAQQMLSASDTWEKGMRLWQVGLRLALLCDSICFEVASDPSKREDQLRKNKNLVEQNAGVLAPVTSQERFLSVSCSHRCAWLRAVAANCHGPSGEQVQLRKGEDRSDGIRQALDVGWQWLVVSSSVELACPFLPDFFQRALNAGNSNAKQLSEIECGSTDCHSDHARHESGFCNSSSGCMRPCVQNQFRCDWGLRCHVWRWRAHGVDRFLVEVQQFDCNNENNNDKVFSSSMLATLLAFKPYWLYFLKPFWLLLFKPTWLHLFKLFWLYIFKPFWLWWFKPFWLYLFKPYWLRWHVMQQRCLRQAVLHLHDRRRYDQRAVPIGHEEPE